MNKKVIFVLSAIMLLATMTGCNTDKKENRESNSNIASNETSNKEEKKDKELFVIETIYGERQSLAVADNKFLESGSKKIITDSTKIYDIKTFNNKVYFIDENKMLNIYDVETEETKKYKISKAEVHFNTEILPGNKNVVISDSSNFEIINLDNNTSNTVVLNNKRGSGIYDEENNLIYFANNKGIYSYNINTKENNKVSDVSGYPMYIYDNNIYIEGEESINDVFYTIDRKTKQVNKLNIKDYSPDNFSMANFNIVDGVIYLTYNNNDKLIRYENGIESILLGKDYLDYFIIGENIYIGAAKLECTDICGAGEYSEFYVYNMKTKELKEDTNIHIKKIFTDSSKVYYINK